MGFTSTRPKESSSRLKGSSLRTATDSSRLSFEVNDKPTDLALSGSAVAEHSPGGTLIGAFATSDLNGTDAHTYQLLVDAGGLFGLSADGKSLVVANPSTLDYEQTPTHIVTVRSTDPYGATVDRAFSITLADLATEIGSALGDVLTGGAGPDSLYGLAGNDALTGVEQGRDILSGGLGRDLLAGGAGRDCFVFSTKALKSGIDRIIDFRVADDSIYLENAIFKALGKKGSMLKPLKVGEEAFHAGNKAHDADDHVIYNKRTGALFYDADGNGAAAQVQIATLHKNLNVTYKDFFVI